MAKERILVADDEPDVLYLVVDTLRGEGYEVEGAPGGAEAIALAEQRPFDLFLTDIKMPDIDGLAAFRAISAQQPEMVAIAMTGYHAMDIVIQALQLGFTDFIVKPFDPSLLALRISRALEKAHLRRENQRLQALLPLLDLSRHLLNERRPSLLFQSVCSAARQATKARSAAVIIPSEAGLTIAAASDGIISGEAVWRQIARRALIAAEPLHLRAHHTATLPPPLSEVIAVALTHQGQPLGVLVVVKTEGDPPFAAVDAELLGVLGGQAAVAIANATLFEERERAYAELAKMDQMKSDFINIATHELRTPLTLILGYSDFLGESISDENRPFLEAIVQNGNRLRAILDDMVQLHHFDVRHSDMNVAPTDLLALLNHVIERLQGEVVPPPTVVRRFPDALPTLLLDGPKIEIAFSNLLMNAAKYGPAVGTITVGAEATESEVIVSVADEGPGVPVEEQANIWRRFYQIGSSLSRRYGGMGLGLPLVRGLIERHGGRTWVESDGESGSTFYFALPREE